jgi:hypothetical protein
MTPHEETVPCATCGEPTHMTGTERCDRCYEVETRLEEYLRRGGDKAAAVLRSALEARTP